MLGESDTNMTAWGTPGRGVGGGGLGVGGENSNK